MHGESIEEQRSVSQPDLSKETEPPSYVATRKRKQHCDLEDMTSIRTEIKEMLASLNKDREDQNAKFNEAINELKSQNAQIIQTNVNIEKILERTTLLYDNLHQKVDIISAEHNEAKTKIVQLENQMEEMQRAQRATIVEIRSVPETKGEDLRSLLMKVHSVLQIPANLEQVKQVRRIKNGQTKLIVAEYQTTQQSMNVIKAVKEYNNSHQDKFNTRCIDIEGDAQPVYISESLTPATRKLFYFARDLRKNNGYKHCWTRHGRVFVKETDTAPAILIKSISQIEELKNMNK
jgi:DNA repair exonuclease SbcCD ATPase subunit